MNVTELEMIKEEIDYAFEQAGYEDCYEASVHYYCEDENEEWGEDFAYQYDFEYIGAGASKLVLYKDDSHLKNYVIKLPYIGEREYDYNEEEECYHDHEFCGVTHYEFPDIKIPAWDHCKYEVLLYEKAVAYGVDKFFTPIYFVSTYGKEEWPIYISPRCKDTWYNREGEMEASEDSKKKAKEIFESHNDRRFINPDVLGLMIDQHGLDAVMNLISFLGRYHISDLHGDNIGIFDDGTIQIIDYAGFENF